MLAGSLRYLMLSHNWIESVHNNKHNVSFQLESLDISYNRISYLDLESLGTVVSFYMTKNYFKGTIEIHSINADLKELYISLFY